MKKITTNPNKKSLTVSMIHFIFVDLFKHFCVNNNDLWQTIKSVKYYLWFLYRKPSPAPLVVTNFLIYVLAFFDIINHKSLEGKPKKWNFNQEPQKKQRDLLLLTE